jgi:hypothetical protein
MRWQLDLGKKELLSFMAAFIAIGFAQPWWLFVLVAAFAGAVTSSRKAKSLFMISAMAGASWVSAALFRDIMTGARNSVRLSALFMLPHPLFLYLFLFLLAALLAFLAAIVARMTAKIYLGEKP